MENQELQTYQKNLPRKQVILAILGVMASMFLGSIFMTVTSTAMPRIITDLGGFSLYTWVFTVYIIAETISLPLSGKLSDMYGRKWLFVIGMSLFVIGSFLSGFSQTMTQLIGFRVIQGFGFGAMSALGFIVIADLFPPEERGKYNGIMSGVFGVSTVIGPTLGGILTDMLSWRWCFWGTVPVGVAIIILFILTFPNFKSVREKHKIDFAGITFLSLAIVPLILALNWAGSTYAWTSPLIIGLFVFAVIMILIFLKVEIKAKEPVIPVNLFKNRVVAVSCSVAFLQGASFFSVLMFVPLFLQGVLGASATESGGYMTPMMLGMSFGSFLSGQFLSRTGGHYRLQGNIGFVISGFGFLLLAGMSPATTLITASILVLITGFGNGIIMPIHTIAVQNTVPYSVMGSATSLITLLRPLGGVFGMSIVGAVMNNKFASYFITNLPEKVKAIVSMDQLKGIIDNPQALVNPEAFTTMQKLLDGAGQDKAALFDQLVTTLREALNSALTSIFLIFMIIVILAFLVNMLLKGIPKYQDINKQ